MLLQRSPIRFPHVDIEADLRHVIREKLLDLRFVPGDAGNGDHLLQKRNRFFATVVDLLHKRLADTRTHLRSSKKAVGRSVIRRRSYLSQSAFIHVVAYRATPPAMNFTLECRRCTVA